MHPRRILLILVGWSFREPQSEQAEAVDRQAATDAVRAQVGEAGLADWAVGIEN